MKAKDVQIGEVYTMKVGANTTSVRITSEHPHGGWVGSNINTGKSVHIGSADRICQIHKPKTTAEKSATIACVETKSESPGYVASSKESQSRGGSQIAGAITVLTEAGQPLSCKEIVDRMLADGLWTTKGATPANTLYSAFLREIKVKGDAARFRKAGTGKFMLNR